MESPSLDSDDYRKEIEVPETRTHAPDGRPRARALGIPFEGQPGPLNSITDVPGVRVGHATLIDGDGDLQVGRGPVRTGVTVVLPRGIHGIGDPCTAGRFSLNGNGEMTGTAWIDEVGLLTLPVAITNTHSVGAVHRALVQWAARTRPDLAAAWLLPVVAETWDGYLNDINGDHVHSEHVEQAIDSAIDDLPQEGSVGGSTGMNCYSFKGGSGTASRVVQHGTSTYTVGALVQANFGDREELRIAGVPVGAHLADDNPMGTTDWFERDGLRASPPGAGSVIVIIATDAPLLPGQCEAMARRVPLGLARTGTTGGHFSGDLFLAFSTGNSGLEGSRIPVRATTDDDYESLRFIPWGRLDPFLAATAWAVEEAVINALVVNADMVGRDEHRSPALPHDRVVELLSRSGVGAQA